MIEETKIKKLKESKLYRASYDIVGGCEKTLGPDSNIYSGWLPNTCDEKKKRKAISYFTENPNLKQCQIWETNIHNGRSCFILILHKYVTSICLATAMDF